MNEETPKLFSLRLSGEGINIEQEIEQRVALQVVQVVMGGSAATFPTTSAKPNAGRSDSVSLSLREHLDKIGASKKPEQITAIAHYICEIEDQADFGRDDIRSRFITAREPPPANFGRDFNVTAKGAQAVNSNFSNRKGTAPRR
jgi:hypothetical protein